MSYSLGIIMTEVVTAERPFQDFLDYVDVRDMIDAIAGRISITSHLPKKLQPMNTAMHIRPLIPSDLKPEFAEVWIVKLPSFH